MADVEKLQTLDGILDYPDASDTSKGTTEQQFQEYLKNQNAVAASMVGMSLWQPSTAYVVGQVIKSPNMNPNTVARVTTAGTTGSAEPAWGAAGSTTSDGTVAYLICYEVVDYATQAEVNAGTNATKIVTPATLKEFWDVMKQTLYPPIGSVLSFADSSDPNVLWKGTTWVKFAEGRVLVGAGSYTENGTTYTYTVGDTGGEVKHKLTADEMPSHRHSLAFGTTNISFSFSIRSQSKNAANVLAGTSTTVTRREQNSGNAVEPSSAGSWYRDELSFNQNITPSVTLGSTGGNGLHENRMPYQVVSFWRRTA